MKKNKLKKILSIALALALTMGILPTKVLASETNIPTRTTMLDVSKITETTDMLESEGWKWIPTDSGGTLMLKNSYIQGEDDALRLPYGDISIILEGENTIETRRSTFGSTIRSDGPDANVESNITIVAKTDDAKLNILRKDASPTKEIPYGIGGNNITIKSGDIYTNMGFCIIVSRFALQGGSLKIDTPNVTDSDGIYTIKGNVDITGGNLDIDTGRVGIWMPGDTGEGERKVNITGGDVKIRSGFGAIYAKNIIINTNGNLDLQGDKFALKAFQKNETGAVLEILSAGSIILDGTDHYLPKVTDENTTVTISEANYSQVETAITKANALNPDDYASDLTNVKAAVDAVVKGKKVLEQNLVNSYALSIENAIKALEPKKAIYDKVDAAIAKIPSDLSIYTKDSVNALNDAKNAVIRGKDKSEQGIVDGYAKEIENALANLKKKTEISITNSETGVKIEYDDGTPIEIDFTLAVVSKSQAEMNTFKNDIDKAAPGFVLDGLYDISMMKDGLKIQPNGKLKISIPLTDTMKAMTNLKVVYISDSGNVTVIPSEVKDGHIIFVTDHLSYYGVIGKTKDTVSDDKNSTNKSPETSDSSSIELLVMMTFVSGIGLVILRKKSRKYES
ncbi:hypothetical protein [Amedibacillus sp. YH-ame10]